MKISSRQALFILVTRRGVALWVKWCDQNELVVKDEVLIKDSTNPEGIFGQWPWILLTVSSFA